MSEFETIRFEHVGAIARITLAKPKQFNATSPTMVGEILRALDETEANKARVLVISGEGPAFSSGAEIKDKEGRLLLTGDLGQVLEDLYNPLLGRLMHFPIPIISLVNGVAAGAGCSLALAADFVVASRSAYFLMAFVKIGLVPDMGATWLLPRLVGLSRATSLLMLGDRLNAETAEQWGMIHKCVDPDDLERYGAELAARLGSGPTVAYGLLRSSLRAALHQPLGESLERERRDQRTAGYTRDCAEGVDAFVNKRLAVFTGE